MPPEASDAETTMTMEPAVSIVEIRTTFSSRDKASACASELVNRRFAACVQVDGPITSCYRWQGRIEMAEEFRCTCKTTPARAEPCIEFLTCHHEYQTPEVICTTVTSSAAYAAWVHANVTTD